MSLAIINREPHGGSIPPGVPVWRTCLREVLFSQSADPFEDAAGSTLGMLVEGRAYRLLLEILCGLQSPMIGETQVVAQFKGFLAGLPQEHAWIRRTGQRLLADARQVRTAHLHGLGSRSYGRAVRRCIGPSETPVLIGTGKLAAEILAFVAEAGRTVHQWGRAPLERISAPFRNVQTLPGVSYRTLESLDSFPGTDAPAVIVIAAPAPSSTVARAAAAYRGLSRVVDLRAEAEADPLVVPVSTITLRDLFTLMDDANRFLLTQIEAARAEIADRSRRYEQRDEVRPFGWDDLCA
jgi:glutamyl-tRNA reductase